MAKIGTAHIEIKPILNEEALAVIVQRIEDAIAAGVARALNETNRGARVTSLTVSDGITVWQDGKPTWKGAVAEPGGAK